MFNKPFLSIIIPCAGKKTKINSLLDDIKQQNITYKHEIIPVYNISPAGLARNQGAQKAKGKILIFIDSDIRLGNPFVLENLSHCILDDTSIGAAAASIQIPADATLFEKMYSRQIPHSQSPIVEKITPVWVATSACCAVNQHIFFRVGQFNPHIPRGQDPEFSFRLRRRGYSTVIAPQTWCYHHQPKNVKQMIELQLRNGKEASFVDRFWPELNININAQGIIYKAKPINKPKRLVRFIAQALKALCKIQLLFILSKLFYAVGYIYGSIKYFFKNEKKR